MTPEFSRTIDAETISESSRDVDIAADEAERRRLAGRFGLKAIDSLAAGLRLARRAGIIHVDGSVEADVVQSCVVTGEPLPVHVDAPVSVRFVPDGYGHAGDEEVELSAEDCDTLPLQSGRIDIGELAAETLALSLDPFPRSAGADQAMQESSLTSEAESGPFAALKSLKDRMEKGG